MLAENEIDEGVGFFKEPLTHEEIAEEWRTALAELGLSPVELADYMKKQGGDYRPYQTILRGIQRMIAGETRVSGEMFVIVRMLLRQHRRLKARHPNVEWSRVPTGAVSAQVEGYTVFLSPQSKGRWIVSCRDEAGFSPEFGRWQDSLQAAKNKALVCVEEGMSDIAYLRAEQAKE
ncbi:hypothetical protein M2323_003365 [Rhodoblastus acidophilus]|uniref:hypothetical protein n=1 Tax=Rhodoblastus acidophilus TaxID=1074 RepID=UPI0022240842|nr:hypothetical protein [Rhodoblastus acidophilus]MCW2285492.1 hypothetical protein [Rhodoblastus acidophilus]MCW2334424.1 hypothetical protein [Rhodoblastus acidophilus]